MITIFARSEPQTTKMAKLGIAVTSTTYRDQPVGIRRLVGGVVGRCRNCSSVVCAVADRWRSCSSLVGVGADRWRDERSAVTCRSVIGRLSASLSRACVRRMWLSCAACDANAFPQHLHWQQRTINQASFTRGFLAGFSTPR